MEILKMQIRPAQHVRRVVIHRAKPPEKLKQYISVLCVSGNFFGCRYQNDCIERNYIHWFLSGGKKLLEHIHLAAKTFFKVCRPLSDISLATNSL